MQVVTMGEQSHFNNLLAKYFVLSLACLRLGLSMVNLMGFLA